ncbi:MAG: hypothetical protein V7677_09920 [Motiliproteus sp.]
MESIQQHTDDLNKKAAAHNIDSKSWPEKWSRLSDSEAHSFVQELKSELPQGHLLTGLPLKAIGRRDGRDQFLFLLEDGSNKLATVHLTWSEETDPKWPWTEIFNSFDHWITSVEGVVNARLHNQQQRISC